MVTADICWTLYSTACQRGRMISAGRYSYDRIAKIVKKFLSVMVAPFVLLQNVREKPGYFQLMMNVLLNKQKVIQNFMAALSAFSLAPSRSYKTKGWLEKVIDQYKNGLVIKPRDLVIIYFNNIGYKILGPGRHLMTSGLLLQLLWFQRLSWTM